MGFFFDGGFGGLCAFWARSISGSLLVVVALVCFLNIENTGRRFWSGGGELRGVGDDGGLDRANASEKMAGDSFGLDGGDEDFVCEGEEFSIARTTGGISTSVSILSTAVSTRRRFVGGSS